jgi:hypothetical protein
MNEVGSAVTVRDEMELVGGEEPSGLVALAIREKVPVEVLERLVALQERVSERNARAAYFAALSAFQDECPEIHKSKKAKIATASGGSYEYTFAPLEEITRTIRPVLHRHGLAYSWTTEPGQNGALNVVCVLRHIDGHSESARFPVPTESPSKMSAAQKNGAALTYGRRQSLIAVLGLTTSDDTDGAPAHEEDEDVFLTTEQMDTIGARLDEVGADFQRFLTFMGVGALKEIKAGDYDKAIRALDRKRAVQR